MKKNPEVYLKHILDYIEKIESNSNNKTVEYFLDNTMLQDALIREIEVIGEAMNNLEKNFIKDYPQIPWYEVIATRNNLIHEYWDIDLERIWEDVTIEVPKLKLQIEAILKSLGNEAVEK